MGTYREHIPSQVKDFLLRPHMLLTHSVRKSETYKLASYGAPYPNLRSGEAEVQ
jgi:hypothetical protein